ncbi:Predicted metal-dependent hydrolase [Streptacidiphilus jiangxiensis]|uniref:Predicted metal-dependent hydrolase n=2 Tax=Streptacidiphilus jiangxiensis TaxID=235985 RepID=A0A1H7Y976_STRJI|nr:Predicted metal-dependent hydrolase [Streptacidiphilus jiangxiensis]
MTALAVSTEHAPLQARRVSFDWTRTPLHWVPDDPFATHMINVLHLLLPAGERWFVDVYKQALPLVRDARLREDMIGFIGQEAVHSQAHSTVLDHMIAQGLDPSPYTAQMDWFFEHLLGDHTAPPAATAWWLKERVAIIAAIEHFTAVLGKWVLEARGFERFGADPVMVDLLRWHGAEEVEHRSVAFDVYQHVDGRYGRRMRAMTTVFPTMFWLWVRGVKFFIANDPQLTPAQRKALEPKIKDWVRAAKAELVPSPKEIFTAVPRFMRKRYHPTQEGSTAKALAYLAGSPAARAAAEQAEAATRPLQLVVAERREAAQGVAELVLSSTDGAPLPTWEPGAHLDLLLPSGLVRQYSLCGDPADRDTYRIGVRLTEDTRGGSKEVHETLTAGASVSAHRPRNRFPLAPGAGPRFFVAGGIGITPILPMVRESAARGSDWRLLYIGRSRTSMPFLDEITALSDAEAQSGDSGESRVTVVETDVEGLPDLSWALEAAPHGAVVHVCGPEPLMEAVVTTLAELRPGVEARLERFHPAEGAAHGDTVQVELRRSGTTLTVPADRSVLSAVRERLPDVAYSCEQGFCGTCKVRVLGGTPEHRDDLLTVEERADSMLICVSRSQDGKLVLDL